jgi:hypothetical protein
MSSALLALPPFWKYDSENFTGPALISSMPAPGPLLLQ